MGEFTERDLKIFQHALDILRKRVAKAARAERQLDIQDGAFCELEDYIEHLERKVEAARLAAEGKRALPLSRDCEGFDYINGCPGHEK
jgi:hypothetical protein